MKNDIVNDNQAAAQHPFRHGAGFFKSAAQYIADKHGKRRGGQTQLRRIDRQQRRQFLMMMSDIGTVGQKVA